MRVRKPERLPQVLFEIGKAIGSHENVGNLLGHISQRICELCEAQACSIMLLDSEGKRLLGKAAYGLNRRDISLISFRMGEGIAGWVAETGESALIGDVSNDPRFKILPDSESRIRSLACVPLDCRGGRVGVITITSDNADAFTPEDIDLVGFLGKTIALDLENLRLRKVSITDPLTGVYNREYLQQQMPELLNGALARMQPLSVAMVDADHFKSINDSFGHDVGDIVLCDIAHRIRLAIRSHDLLIRYGGEEFLVIFPELTGSRAFDVAERIRSKVIEAPASAAGQSIKVQVSLGVAEWKLDETPGELIKRADRALYEAKAAGRNRVQAAI